MLPHWFYPEQFSKLSRQADIRLVSMVRVGRLALPRLVAFEAKPSAIRA